MDAPTGRSTEGLELRKPVLAGSCSVRAAHRVAPHPARCPVDGGAWAWGSGATGLTGGRELAEVVGRKAEDLGERQGRGG